MTTKVTRLAWAVAMGGACAMASLASATVGNAPADTNAAAPGSGDATALADRLCQSLHALPDGSRPEQYEAALVYAISQANTPYGTRQAALRMLPTSCALTPGMTTALNNAQYSGGTGTGALGSGGFNGSSGFSSPGIDVGGGSVNYTSGRR